MALARSFRVDPVELRALVEELQSAVDVVTSRTEEIHGVLPEAVANVGIPYAHLGRATSITPGRVADLVNGTQTATPDEAVKLAQWMTEVFNEVGEPIPYVPGRKPKTAKRKLEPVRDLNEDEWE